MFAAALPSKPVAESVQGRAEITFVHADGQTRLGRLYHSDPLRVLFPNPEPGDIPSAALVTISGGLVGGDKIAASVSVGSSARAQVIASAAEKVYRSSGADVDVSLSLKVESGAWLEWLPQETILFDGARLKRRTDISVAEDGRLLAGEILVYGRAARDENFTTGLLRDSWFVRRGGTLAWADALRLEGDLTAKLAAKSLLNGARASATLVFASPDAGVFLALARSRLVDQEGLYTGASLVNGLLVARWIGSDTARLRESFGAFWAELRARAAGLPEQLPRLWHI